MVQTLDGIKGGGGSVKIGTTGTIGDLMSRELDSAKNASKMQPAAVPASVLSEEKTPRKSKPKMPADEAMGSGSNIAKNHKFAEASRKSKQSSGSTHHIPMLTACDVSVDGTPLRKKPIRKTGLVEIVDVKCGNSDKTWVNPITNRLKKLGFSKLSESIV